METQPMQDTEGVKEKVEEKMDPKTQKQVDNYSSLLTSIIHAPDSTEYVVEGLQGNPKVTVPTMAIAINKQAEQVADNSKNRIPLKAKFISSIYLVKELINLGNMSKAFEQPVQNQEEFSALYKLSLQQYIQAGIKEKTIDPVELQAAVEPLLDDNQRAVGNEIAQTAGMASEPTIEMAANTLADRKARNASAKTASAMEQAANQKIQQGGQNG